MRNSIQQFSTDCPIDLEGIQNSFFADPTKIAEFVENGSKPFIDAALRFIGETFTEIDNAIRNSAYRKRDWYIVRTEPAAELICSVGVIRYQKTLYKNRETGETVFLADRVMGIKPKTRMTEDAEARMLAEASDSSYRKGGIAVSLTTEVSRQTVLNKLHNLEFPREQKRRGRKRKVEYLYIDADEDHVSLQYDKEKGDLKGQIPQCVMPPLIYVYEDVCETFEGSGRNELKNAHYFGGLYDGGPQELWKEVDAYIRNNYDEDTLKTVFINGDGAGWIKAGRHAIPKSVFVLDSFHMHKYIIAATSHLKDSKEDARDEIYHCIHKRSKKAVRDVFEHILAVTDSESKRATVQRSMDYLMNNWAGIMASLHHREVQHGCSAEGHVSHVYSDRLSSRPLGWSRIGADKMARLRVYRRNGGNMLELVRYQKYCQKKAAGAEDEVILSAAEVMGGVEKTTDLGKYYDVLQASFAYPRSRKEANIIYHKWF